MAFFGSSKPIILRTEASFDEGQSAALLQTTDRHMTGTLHQPNNDRDGEDVKPNRKRRIGHRMGQGEAETLPTWSTQIQILDCPQATCTFSSNEVKAKVPPRIKKNGSLKCKTWITRWCTNQERMKQTLQTSPPDTPCLRQEMTKLRRLIVWKCRTPCIATRNREETQKNEPPG